jgi:hypothetical protein
MFDRPTHSQINTAASKYAHDKIHTSVSLHIKSGEICDGLTIDILLVRISFAAKISSTRFDSDTAAI